MKFTVSSTTLLKELQSIAGVLNSSNTLPILDNFLFDLQVGELTLSASDLETTMVTTMPVDSNDSIRLAVPAKLILDSLKNFPEQPLTFSVDEKTFSIEISTDNGKFKLAGFSGEDFPKMPAIEEATKVNIDSDALLDAINYTLFATGNDDLRPVMSGVFFEFGPDHLRFVATDAHKLVRYSRSDFKADSLASFIVPKKPLNLLKGQLAGLDGDVNIEYNQKNVRFSIGDITLVSRLIDGKFPNYEAVIPAENPNRMVIGRSDILAAIRRASIYSNKTTHQVRLKLAGADLNVSAEDLDFSSDSFERLTCSYDGEDMEIGFNSRFIIDMLNHLDTDEVSLELSAPNRAGILKPAGGDNQAEDVLMLVMPVMLNN